MLQQKALMRLRHLSANVCEGVSFNLSFNHLSKKIQMFKALCVALLAALGVSGPARASEFGSDLLDFRIGGRFSSVAQRLALGGYELAQGEYVSFDQWYTPRMREISVQFLTAVAPDLGVTWGFGTGERGAKYRIQPSLQIGFIYQKEVFPNGWLSFIFDGVIGGNFSEKTCVADYGAIGGIQTVNCRYAAEPIAPSETLKFMEKRRGYTESRATLAFEFRF